MKMEKKQQDLSQGASNPSLEHDMEEPFIWRKMGCHHFWKAWLTWRSRMATMLLWKRSRSSKASFPKVTCDSQLARRRALSAASLCVMPCRRTWSPSWSISLHVPLMPSHLLALAVLGSIVPSNLKLEVVPVSGYLWQVSEARISLIGNFLVAYRKLGYIYTYSYINAGRFGQTCCFRKVSFVAISSFTIPGQVALMVTDKVKDLLENRNNAKKEDDRDKITFASVIGFANYIQEDDIADLLGSGGPRSIFRGKLQAGDLLYTPASMVAGEQVLGDDDHFGCKISMVARNDERGLKCLRSFAMEAKDQNRKNAQLDQVIAVMDQKNKEMAEAAARAAAADPVAAGALDVKDGEKNDAPTSTWSCSRWLDGWFKSVFFLRRGWMVQVPFLLLPWMSFSWFPYRFVILLIISTAMWICAWNVGKAQRHVMESVFPMTCTARSFGFAFPFKFWMCVYK